MKIRNALLGLGIGIVAAAIFGSQPANAADSDSETGGVTNSKFHVTTISAADLPSLYSIRDESLQRVNDAVAKDMQEVMNLQAKANVLNEAQFYGIEHQHEVFWITDIQDNHNVEHVILDSQFTPEMQSYLEATDAEYDIMICQDCITSDVLGQKAIDLSDAFGAVGLTNTLGTDELGQGLEVQSFATEATAMAEGGDVSPDLGISQSALDFLHQLYITGTFEGVPVKFFVNPDPSATVVDVTAQTQSGLIVSGGNGIGLDPTVVAYCTGGFIVTNNQIAGISTAGHCDGQATAYEGNIYQPGGTAPAAKGGVVWYGLNARVVSKFQSSFGVYTTVTGQAKPIIGHLYCKFGVVSGETCALIYQPNKCAYALYTGVRTCSLWAVYANVSLPGDSGGPWFDGSTAIGIHFGVSNVDGVNRSLFSDMASLEAAGAQVLVGTFGTPAV